MEWAVFILGSLVAAAVGGIAWGWFVTNHIPKEMARTNTNAPPRHR